jgi:hypothetical protein
MEKGIVARPIEFSSTDSIPSLESDTETAFDKSFVKRDASININIFSNKKSIDAESGLEVKKKPKYRVTSQNKMKYGGKYGDMAKDMLQLQIKNQKKKKTMSIDQLMGSLSWAGS